ncbi:methyltransferase domain-containing protein [Kurthia sibirica]|uniref:Trans-aconitate methyltransferase n=1 Tax=Kurthia sibirica TaxID=202750 RepID=A0A2U3AIJ5_9BACL|nr:methyltransferase domain-containing protein [Kurthia sibirica]PWI24373.1 trans-aconitate methyltransferase [Kurthia sibirica]GEK33790.1 trans-aconitate 2-methyltransferase [Kurthia sibirica]
MTQWNPMKYLQFEQERTQPAIDLLQRIREHQPRKIIDLGCGPGNSTAMLAQFFPQATIVGVDYSAEMIAEARKVHPELIFQQCDVSTELATLDTDYDLVFSNACLQWIPRHEELIPQLMACLNVGGVLAVQIPNNRQSALYQAIDNIVAQPTWAFQQDYLETNEIGTVDQYFELLSKCSQQFDIWQQLYYHRMTDPIELIEWVKSTRLRPFLAQLASERHEEFIHAILQQAASHYPPHTNGQLLFEFKRLFFTAIK